jgi:hypothetical protein
LLAVDRSDGKCVPLNGHDAARDGEQTAPDITMATPAVKVMRRYSWSRTPSCPLSTAVIALEVCVVGFVQEAAVN